MTSVDLSKTIESKSDQLNAADLTGAPRTVVVRGVRGLDDPEQPIAVDYQGDNDKPYKPCKTMRRLLMACWGMKGQDYVGRSMTLWCDPTVTYQGGIAVGGVRISALSHIDEDMSINLRVSKMVMKAHPVKRLAPAETDKPTADTDKPETTDIPETTEELKWSLKSDGSHELECTMDPGTPESVRALYSALANAFRPFKRSEREVEIATAIYTANALLIAAVPEAGRVKIEELYNAIVTPHDPETGEIQ